MGGTQGPEGGGQKVCTPLKNHKNIGFPSNIDPDPLKSQSYQASIQWWTIIDMPAKRHFNGVSLMGRWWHFGFLSDEPAQVCILNTALMAQICQASDRFYVEWINFVSHNSNHNLEKGPFVY